MEVTNSYAATTSSAELTSARRQQAVAAQPKENPLGTDAPEPKSRGAAVVFGGSLANLDPSTKNRDAERQSKVEDKRRDGTESTRQAALQKTVDDRTEAGEQRANQRQDEREKVDVRV